MTALAKLTKQIDIEMTGDTKMYLVSAKQGDKATRYISVRLLHDGMAYTIPADARVAFNVKKPDGKHVYNTCTHSGSEVTVELTNQTLAVAGTAYCDIEVRTSDNTQLITSASFTIEIEKSMRSDDAILSSNEFTEIEDRIAGHIKEMDDMESAVRIAEYVRVENENKRTEAEQLRQTQEKERQKNTSEAVENAINVTEISEEATRNCVDVTQRAEAALMNEEQLEEALRKAEIHENNAALSAANAEVSENESEENATVSSNYAAQSKHYYEQARAISESFAGALRPMGTVAFANLPSIENAAEGDMYNISDQFTTNANFEEGSGHTIPAGSNVYKTANGKWDILAGSPVTSVNGQTGNVNVTPENIGLGNVDNTADKDKNVASATRLSKARNIFGQSFNGTADIAGKGQFYGAYNSDASQRYRNSAIEVKENGNVGNTQSDNAYAPSIGFHWTNRIAAMISLFSDGVFHFLSQNGTTRATIDANLNGNADSATKATQDGNGNNIPNTYLKKTEKAASAAIADSATKATQDGDGNVFKDSYVAKKVITGGDFNSMTTPGIYTMKSTTSNAPTSGGYHSLIVLQSDTENYIQQIAVKEGSADVHVRYKHNTTWGMWIKLLNETDTVTYATNASTATKAANDGNGNNIPNTYQKKGYTHTNYQNPVQNTAYTLPTSAQNATEWIIFLVKKETSGECVGFNWHVPVAVFTDMPTIQLMSGYNLGSLSGIGHITITKSSFKVRNFSYASTSQFGVDCYVHLYFR